jgi:hypothetical protein
MPTVYSPPVSTYVPIATYTVTGSPDASVTFSSIPATYRDLFIACNFSAGTAGTFSIRANGDSGTNYSRVWMLGSGSGSGNSGTSTNDAYRLFSYSATQAVGIAQIMDYSATDKHKTLLWRGNDASAEVIAIAARWANTDAINQVEIFSADGTFSVGSTFSLYGIAS